MLRKKLVESATLKASYLDRLNGKNRGRKVVGGGMGTVRKNRFLSEKSFRNYLRYILATKESGCS